MALGRFLFLGGNRQFAVARDMAYAKVTLLLTVTMLIAGEAPSM